MKRFGWTLSGLVALGGVGSLLISCARDLSCGSGTVEQNGQCVAAQSISTSCDPDAGDEVIDGICVPSTVPPLICGDNTLFDPVTGKCKGTGGGNVGCASTCSAPNASTVCITGAAKFFISGMNLDNTTTATNPAKVRIYDPIAFATNPRGTQPLATASIEDMGCYIADGVPRPGSGVIAVAIDDADNSAAGPDFYANMGSGALLQPNKNVTGLTAFAVTQAEVAKWQNDIGAGLPDGCTPAGLEGCGMWIGHYLDKNGMPVANARPTRPGDDPPLANVFCFRGADANDRTTLSTADTTDATGLCVISPDSLESHGGACATDGCMCGTTPCTPSWTALTGGTAPGVIFYQPFPATM